MDSATLWEALALFARQALSDDAMDPVVGVSECGQLVALLVERLYPLMAGVPGVPAALLTIATLLAGFTTRRMAAVQDGAQVLEGVLAHGRCER